MKQPAPKKLVRRRTLWLGFAAVFIPLGLLIGMQYKWLTRLERTSAIAEKAWLDNYLEAVSEKTEYFYRKQAERSLNLPSSLLAYDNPKKIGHYFKKKEVEGAKYLFAYTYSPSNKRPVQLIFDPRRGTLGKPEDHRINRAIQVALAPWAAMLERGEVLQSHALIVDEKDPWNRIILNPLSDDGCTLIGVAGMVVDTRYFEKKVLPRAIEEALPKYFDERAQENLVIGVRDGGERWVLGTESEMADSKEVSRRVSFVFTDWRLVLGSRHTTVDQWAQSNFILNMSLSILLGVVLLGGIILALRMASREMHLSQMKSDFVSNVSHELRTPLASIRVFGEFLRLGRVDSEEKIREYGEFIEMQSSRLTQLINNILDFSKIESGAKTYRFERTDLHEVLADALRSLEVSLKHMGFRLHYRGPSRVLSPIRIDSDAVSQALANLVDNAVKYSGDSKEIEVTLDSSGQEVVIAVTDHGIGISDGEQRKVFERFHRVGTGLIHDVKGSGLGLSIVEHIVSAHGGRVRVRSEPGRGSTFAIHLPVVREAGDAADLEAGIDSVEQLEKT